MIMENYHQSDDELDHNDKSELRQSNHYTDVLDTINLMKTINTIYSVFGSYSRVPFERRNNFEYDCPSQIKDFQYCQHTQPILY